MNVVLSEESIAWACSDNLDKGFSKAVVAPPNANCIESVSQHAHFRFVGPDP